MASRLAFMRDTSSSFEEPSGHSDLSFNRIIRSQASKGIGSVGISDVPIFPTTCRTSGNCFCRISAAFSVTLMVLSIDVPGMRRVSTARSPSSRLGINSPPNVKNSARLAENRITATSTTHLLQIIKPESKGAYPR